MTQVIETVPPYPTEVRMSEWTCELIQDSIRRCEIVMEDMDPVEVRHYQAHHTELEGLLLQARALAAAIKSSWDSRRTAP